MRMSRGQSRDLQSPDALQERRRKCFLCHLPWLSRSCFFSCAHTGGMVQLSRDKHMFIIPVSSSRCQARFLNTFACKQWEAFPWASSWPYWAQTRVLVLQRGSRAGTVVHLVLAGPWSIRDQNHLRHLSSGQQGMLSREVQKQAFKISKQVENPKFQIHMWERCVLIFKYQLYVDPMGSIW